MGIPSPTSPLNLDPSRESKIPFFTEPYRPKSQSLRNQNYIDGGSQLQEGVAGIMATFLKTESLMDSSPAEGC